MLFIAAGDEEETVAQPRVLIVAGEESSASVLESYAGVSEGEHLTNAVTEIVVGAAARLDYYKVQRQSEQAYHVTNTHVAIERDSWFSSVNIDMGGRLTRNNLNLVTLDQDCSCSLTGFYMVTGRQHVDNQVIIDHAKPYTTSRELYKGILDGRSRSVFHGSIIVREGAVKVNANQVDKNLLLSDQAEADTKPAFWIYCDDVKCGHGAACGHMDPMALFYLRSRGIDERTARGLLTRAFLSEVIEGIANETLRTQVDGSGGGNAAGVAGRRGVGAAGATRTHPPKGGRKTSGRFHPMLDVAAIRKDFPILLRERCTASRWCTWTTPPPRRSLRRSSRLSSNTTRATTPTYTAASTP